jgi:hypothetical protein
MKRDLSGVQAVMDGIEREPDAVVAFQDRTGLATELVGFVTSDDGRIGCSPDRIIEGQHEGLEIKCPTPQVHIGYMVDGIEEAYKPQIQGQILICRFTMVHFFSYQPELEPVYIRVLPDLAFIAKLEQLLTVFCSELDQAEAIVRKAGVYPKDMESAFPETEEETAF